jgi:hypothetical protein
MKRLVLLAIFAVSVNSMAIEFITEAQVGEKLGAQKVIEVSKYAVAPLIKEGSDCEVASRSKSARAYVVKKGNKAFLYVTESGLKGLNACVEL